MLHKPAPKRGLQLRSVLVLRGVPCFTIRDAKSLETADSLKAEQVVYTRGLGDVVFPGYAEARGEGDSVFQCLRPSIA